jgi:transcription elongation factor Elf1
MTTTTIPCPRCNGELLHAARQAPGILATRIGDPELQPDEKGYFVTCPHCAERIDVDVTSVEGSGARWRIRR